MQKTTTPSPSPKRPLGCTNLKLRQLTRVVSQRYDAGMSATGLKTTQYSLLFHVVKLGPVRPVDLAAQMRMDPSTLTRNLKPLVDAGWVLVAAGADARSRLVCISPAGSAKRAEALTHWRSAQEGLNQTLGLERVAALHAMIDEVLELIAQPSGEGAQDSDEVLHAD